MRHTPLLICLSSSLLIGCTGYDATENPSSQSSDKDSTVSTPVEDSAESAVPENTATEPKSNDANVSVEIRSWSDFQNWISKQKGKVVVVDVWSTSCGECVKEFPHFVELHQRLGDRVVCASLSVDYYGVDKPEDLKPLVMEFLTEKKATTANFLSSTPDEEVMEAIDIASIPAALVYDQSGKLKKTFKNDFGDYGSDGFNYEDHINPFVEQLLQEEG